MGRATGSAYLDFLSGLAVTSLGHATRRSPTALHEQAQTLSTCRTCSAPSPAGRWRARSTAARRRPARLADGGPGPGVLRQLRRRGQRVRHQAGPQVRRPGPPRRGQRLRLVPRPHPRHAARHRPAGQARGLPAAARGLPPRRLERPRRRSRRRSTRRSPRCCSSRCRARAASTRRPPSTSRACAGCATSAGILFMVDEVQTGLGRTRRVVRPPAPRRRARRRHDGQGARQRRAHRRLLGQGRGGRRVRARRPRHHLRRPAARHRGGPRRARGDGGRGRARPRRAGRRAARRRLPRRCPASPRCAASGCCSPPSSTATTPRRWRRALPRAGAHRQRRHARPRCAWRRRSSSPTTRSTTPSTLLAGGAAQ